MSGMSVATIKAPEFINITSVSPLISKCEIKVLYVGENRNMSAISKEVATQMAQTLPGVPIVGYWVENREDFGDHGDQVIIDVEGVKFKRLTRPYGFVSPTTRIWFQEFEDTDDLGNKTLREYLMCEGYLWTEQYEEAKSVINEGRPQSMELDENTLKGYWSNDVNRGLQIFIINDAIFSKLCILGEDVEPCFEGASVTTPEVSSRFSLDTAFSQTLFTMMKQLKDYTYSLQAENNIGGNSMTVENENAVVEEVVETPEIEAQAEVVEEAAAPETVPEEFTQNVEVTEPVVEEEPAQDFAKKEEEEESEEKSDDAKEDDEEDEDDEKKKPASDHTLVEEEEIIKDYKADYEALAIEYTKLQAKYTALESDNKALVEFKNQIEDEKKTELINSFYMLSDEDKADVIANKSQYSLDDIEAKLSVICVRKKVNFTIEEDKKEEENAQPPLTYNLQDSDSAINDSTPAWIKAVESHKNNQD